MDNTLKFIEEIQGTVNEFRECGCDIPFYRGHLNGNFNLLPTLFRDNIHNKENGNLENNLFYDFKREFRIFSSETNSWNVLFQMRHAGIPTRLLDWSESLFVALHFALKDNSKQPCIWILNPFELNNLSKEKQEIFSVEYINDDLKIQYNNFIDDEKKKNNETFLNPIAIYPEKKDYRIFAQKSFFTIHGTNVSPLEEIYPEIVNKHEIPTDSIPVLKEMLNLSGINEFSLYPDLDGLGRYINKIHGL